MKPYFYIAAGGFFGAMARFAVKSVNLTRFINFIPVNTLLVNITGCFILAFLSIFISERLHIDNSLKLGITVGFLGAYTTFSTLCRELAEFIMHGRYTDTLLYAGVSVVLGIGAVYTGAAAAKRAGSRLKRWNRWDS